MTYRDKPQSRYYISDDLFVDLQEIIEMGLVNSTVFDDDDEDDIADDCDVEDCQQAAPIEMEWCVTYRQFGEFSHLDREVGDAVFVALVAYRTQQI